MGKDEISDLILWDFVNKRPLANALDNMRFLKRSWPVDPSSFFTLLLSYKTVKEIWKKNPLSFLLYRIPSPFSRFFFRPLGKKFPQMWFFFPAFLIPHNIFFPHYLHNKGGKPRPRGTFPWDGKKIFGIFHFWWRKYTIHNGRLGFFWRGFSNKLGVGAPLSFPSVDMYGCKICAPSFFFLAKLGYMYSISGEKLLSGKMCRSGNVNLVNSSIHFHHSLLFWCIMMELVRVVVRAPVLSYSSLLLFSISMMYPPLLHFLLFPTKIWKWQEMMGRSAFSCKMHLQAEVS